jgi:hypothetical protein
MRDDRERLLDILEAIERIHRYAVRGREAFEHDELIQKLDYPPAPDDWRGRRAHHGRSA